MFRSQKSNILVGMAFTFFCSCEHSPRDGIYALTATQIVRDDCHLTDNPAVVSEGFLQKSGDTASFDYALFKIHMTGFYKNGLDHFVLDGSASDVTAQVNNRQCVLTLVQLHLEGAPKSFEKFSGEMSIRYQADAPDACICNSDFLYDAQFVQSTRR